MLDASHFDGTGRLNIIATPISLLEDVLDAVKAMLSLHSSGPVITVDTQGDPLLVIGAAMRLKQVVMNLAKNATKFVGNAGFVRIVARRTADGSGVIIRVEDSGPGVPPELDRKALFKRTYEIRDSMRQGTGICACIAEAMGGKVELDETYSSGVPGRPGACFQVTLPLPPAPQREQIVHTKTSTATGTGTQSKARDIESQAEPNEDFLVQGPALPDGAESILVVEHDATLRRSLFRELQKLLPRGDIRSAATGEAALALVAARRGALSIMIVNHDLDGGPGALKSAELVCMLRDRTAAVIVAASASAINCATNTAATGVPATLPGADIVAPRTGLLTQQGCAEMLRDATARPLLRRLLIVDDLPPNRLIMRRLLLKVMPWCQIDEAESGEAALETTNQPNP
jgi:CheY-like chemotaxis protein